MKRWSEWQGWSFDLFAIEITYVFNAARNPCVPMLCTRSKAQNIRLTSSALDIRAQLRGHTNFIGSAYCLRVAL